MFFDTALGREAVMRMASAARATARPPFTIALCAPDDSGLFPTDGQANRPVDEDDARRLIAGSIRLRLPARVLLVDDSPTIARHRDAGSCRRRNCGCILPCV